MDTTTAVANRGCWQTTTDCMSNAATSVSNACSSAGAWISNFWSTNIQPCLQGIWNQLAALYQQVNNYASENPATVQAVIITAVVSVVTTLACAWLCCMRGGNASSSQAASAQTNAPAAPPAVIVQAGR